MRFSARTGLLLLLPSLFVDAPLGGQVNSIFDAAKGKPLASVFEGAALLPRSGQFTAQRLAACSTAAPLRGASRSGVRECCEYVSETAQSFDCYEPDCFYPALCTADSCNCSCTANYCPGGFPHCEKDNDCGPC